MHVLERKALGFIIHEEGTLMFYNGLCVPIVDSLKKKILDEGYNATHSVHPGVNCTRTPSELPSGAI